MVVDKFKIDGTKSGQVELNDSVFSSEVNDTLIYTFIKKANAALRQGTHKTKERAEVRGGGAKPWRQKGTGRARSGTNRSPIWVGGGTVFGPTPRDYSLDMPKKARRAAMRSIFSVKASESKIKVVEDFDIATGKTKDMASVLKNLGFSKGVLLTDSESKMLKRASRNISSLKFNNVKRINGRDIFYSKDVIVTESAVKYLNEMYAKGDK